MNTEQIQNFLSNKMTGKDKYVKIDFRTRASIYGLFLTESKDFKELSTKNFWRIVTRSHFDDYSKSQNMDFARIFNGSEFTKLSLLTDQF